MVDMEDERMERWVRSIACVFLISAVLCGCGEGGIKAQEPDGIRGRTKRGRAGARWFLLLRTISNFTYEMVNTQSETARTAVSGSAGQDVRCFRLVRLDTIYPFH